MSLLAISYVTYVCVCEIHKAMLVKVTEFILESEQKLYFHELINTLLLNSVCVCVYCACVTVGTCMPQCTYRGQGTVSRVSCCLSPCWRQGLLFWCIQQASWLSNSWDFPVSTYHVSHYRGAVIADAHRHCIQLDMGLGDPNSGPLT